MPAINGDPPELAGVVLDAMICTQYWPDGALEDSANVIYFRIHDRWHRLYFDIGTVFWRQDIDEVPDYPGPVTADNPFVNVDLGHDLAIAGRTIKSCITEAVAEHDSKVSFHFDGGGTISFICVGEITSMEHSGLPHRGT